MGFTYEKVLEAYIKLKTYIYYDSNNLFMREQLAVFETDIPEDIEFFAFRGTTRGMLKTYDVESDKDKELYELKLEAFVKALNTYHKSPRYFDIYFKRMTFRAMPKKIIDGNKESKIISNKRTANTYEIERSLVFIDVPIELHLITVLWIMEYGYAFDAALDDSCHGNRLLLNKKKEGIVQGSALFKPYQKQYHRWRDGAVECAKQHLENGTDVLLLNLDIRDFFYSVRIPRKEILSLEAVTHHRYLQHYHNLVTIFGGIHEKFTRMLAEDVGAPYHFLEEVTDVNGQIDHFILPIGLLSSFVLANHHLVDFDKRILKKAKPVYYGRYVDDILMVLVNPILPGSDPQDSIKGLNFDFNTYKDSLKDRELYSDDEKLSLTEYDELWDIENIVLENFFPIISLVDMPEILTSHIKMPSGHVATRERAFKINGYKRLYCQSDKTLLYLFDKDESSLVIDKLKRDLEEKSSEFRNYEDVDDDGEFEESAYHLLYDGSDGKIRTLKDYKEDRFGLTIYLTKKIFNTLRQTEKIPDGEAEKIVRFFKGKNALSLYSLWERVFVYLMVNDKAKHFVEFYFNCLTAINSMDPGTTVLIDREDYRDGAVKYLQCALELSLSLYPGFLSRFEEVRRNYEFSFNAIKSEHRFLDRKFSPAGKDSLFISRYRRSNLIRHHFVAQTLMSYTIDKENTKNFTSTNLEY